MTLDGSQQPVAGRLTADEAGNGDAPGQRQTVPDPFRKTVGLVLGDALPGAVVMGMVLLAWVAWWVLVEVVMLFFLGPTEPEGWTPFVGFIIRVGMGFWVGRILVRHYLSRYVVHGATRSAFLRQAPLIITTLAAYGVVGFAVAWFAERAAYRLFGGSYTAPFWWVDFLDEAAGGALHAILTQEPWWTIWYLGMHWLLFILWAALGALLAAGFARSRLVGLLCVPVCVLLLVVTEPSFFLARQSFAFPGPLLLLALPIASLLAWLLTWMLVARAPIRVGAG